jgi:hypothetical protein
MFDEYFKLTGVKVNYRRGPGQESSVTAGTVDFGGSDGIMTAEQNPRQRRLTNHAYSYYQWIRTLFTI